MKKILSINEMVNNGEVLRVYEGLTVVWPHHKEVTKLPFIKELCERFEHCYSKGNGIIAFVNNNQMYVAPYTRALMRALEGEQFTEKIFNVPFANGEYPMVEHKKWNELIDYACNSYKDDFIDDCECYCTENNIGELAEETMRRSLEMPRTGVKIKLQDYKNIYYPVLQQICLNESNSKYLGKYCCNKGIVLFVYRNGKTYVTKQKDIIQELEAAGFKKTEFFVPFSNGELILDEEIRHRWEYVSTLD